MKNVTAKIAIAAMLALGTNVAITAIASPVMAQNAQSVESLRDVSPSDWSYTAVKNMVERYGCLTGYPDGTFRGNRSMTRNEFAAALNNCIDNITAQIQADTVQVTANDLVIIQRLQQEFQAELATLRSRVDGLEERTAELEKTKPTIKLSGDLITDVGGVFSGESDGNGTEAEDTITAAARLGINLDSNLTDKDFIHARLEASNFEEYSGRFENNGTFNGLATDYDDDNTDDLIEVDELYYQRKLGNGQLTVGTHGVDLEEVAGTADSPLHEYAFIEQFQANPAIAEASEGAGIGYKVGLGENLEVAAAYTLPSISAATTDRGLFDGSNAASAKVTYTPGDKTALSVAYARTHDQGIDAGTDLAANPFGNDDTNGNHIGLSASRQVGRVDLSAHGGVSFLNDGSSDDSATAVNWAAQVGVKDLLGEGNYGGICIGAVPYITGGDVASEDAPLAAQAFYSLKVSEGLAIQPQLVYITNPNGDSGNDNIWAGSVKTTLRF